MADIDPIWWILLAVAVLAALIIWALVARNRRLTAARAQAAELRQHAQEGETYAAGAEERARDLQAKAHEAQQHADQLHEKAEEATRVAREHRDRVTGDYVDADEIDPDAKRR